MTFITLTADRRGLVDFPADFDLVGHDDLGDPLAVDRDGRVWSFVHGSGDWTDRSLAFASRQELERYVQFQSQLNVPADAGIDMLRARKAELEALLKGLERSPYAREALREALVTVREEIADRRFATSKRGRSIAARKELGMRCDEVLRAAGAPGHWAVRPDADNDRDLVVMGRLTGEWDEARVRELLQPIVGRAYRMVFLAKP